MFAGWSEFRRRALLIAVIALVLVFLIWNIPQLDVLLFPFRLFVTFIHEAGHGLAAIATGGRFIGFEINANGSGIATTAGGERALILPAGYLGAALFGAVLFYLANSVPYPRFISMGVGVLVMIIAVLFGGIFSVATIFGVVMGFAIFAVGFRASADINILLLNMLAALTGLNAVLDVFYLVNNSGASIGMVRNDAAAFQAEYLPFVPASVVALVWSGIAVLMLWTAIYYSVIHPLGRREDRRAGQKEEWEI
jgi:hypothetical protein